MIGTQIIFQIYATHTSGFNPVSDNPKFPPEFFPPYDFETLGEIPIVVISQNGVRVGFTEFTHESHKMNQTNQKIEFLIQSIKQITESQPESRTSPITKPKAESDQTPITVYRLKLDPSSTNLISTGTLVIHMYDEKAIVSLAYSIRNESKTYWLQGISPLGYHQVDLGLKIEPNTIT
ncbi:MAG: hypothetical protein ACTSRK_15740 [Promethearchaeota archaeon]